MKKGFLYKRCTRCGKLWNVSACTVQTSGYYVCPDCALRRRKRGRRRAAPAAGVPPVSASSRAPAASTYA